MITLADEIQCLNAIEATLRKRAADAALASAERYRDIRDRAFAAGDMSTTRLAARARARMLAHWRAMGGEHGT